MAIRAGAGGGAAEGGGKGRQRQSGVKIGSDKRRPSKPEQVQAQKPYRPVENSFPEKPEFRLGQYRVVEERDNYLICKGYDPNAKNPFAEITPDAFRKIKVAKPLALQRTVWEDAGEVTMGGLTYEYEYDDEQVGVRTATWTDEEGVEREEEQRIDIPYTINHDDIENVITAVEIRENDAVDGLNLDDEEGGKLTWIDLNVSGRHWKVPVTQGLMDAELTSTMSVATNSKTGATTASAKFLIPDPDNPGDLKDGDSFTVTNRSLDASGVSGTYIVVARIADEWRPIWIDC